MKRKLTLTDFPMKRFSLLLLLAAATFAGLRAQSAREDCLAFLYRYMTLPDSLDRSREFYMANVDAALRARREMPWGATVPEREFRHFVLPVRVNNEALDSARIVIYEELAPRVRGLSMRDAVLEVNHWCHEKATYRPSDARTSSPLQTIRTSWGRCGEESTLAVAALRAVGIPARQVYTPRWAHTDDNHAWVEAWVDGSWHFLGACEPEPELDLAWFNAPASRGMLMTTKVFGRYDGDEEIISRTPYYTEINVTANYAPTDSVRVCVTDAEGRPVAGAEVRFMLYNYAEFFPVAARRADAAGRSSLTTGLGDLIVWATDGRRFGFCKVSAGRDREVVLPLTLDGSSALTAEFDIVPPPLSARLPQPSPEAVRLNEQRKADEDALRTAYMATFSDEWPAACGNHAVIAEFVRRAGPLRPKALRLLGVISEKDLRDVPLDVLLDHLDTPDDGDARFDAYVMNPRVADEALTPYKTFFREAFGPDFLARVKANPRVLEAWVADSIRVSAARNPQRLYISPAAVFRHRRDIDSRSRDVFFVAAARTAGVPARIDPVTGKVQYAVPGGDGWTDARFAASTGPDEPLSADGRGLAATAGLRLGFEPQGRLDDLKYYTHFTLSRMDKGLPRLQNYAEGAAWSELFAREAEVDAGQYVLVSGQRLSDGGVLARVELFDLPGGGKREMPLVLRHDESRVQVIGAFDAETRYADRATGQTKSILSTTGRGYYTLLLVRPGHEPSAHALNDLREAREALERDGRKILVLFADAAEAARWRAEDFPGLPQNVVLGCDEGGRIAAALESEFRIAADDKPVVVVADTFNRVVFLSTGYTINLGQKLAELLGRLE